MPYWGGSFVEASVVEAHEGFFFVLALFFFDDGGVMVLLVQSCVALPDVASPLVCHVELELGGLACSRAVGDHDAGAQGHVVWVFIIDRSDEVGKGVFVNVW